MTVNYNKLHLVSQVKIKEEEQISFNQLLKEAEDEMNFYNWCKEIKASYVGLFYPGILGVFLFHIEPNRPDVDDLIWVIVGDLPPLYLTTDDCPDAVSVLNVYIDIMSEWASAAVDGSSIDELPPINVPAIPENGLAMFSRLEMLKKFI